jgi:hypothetical protein
MKPPAIFAECTNCQRMRLIALQDTLDWGVPYKLCGDCNDHLSSLDDAEAAQFAIQLWQKAAIRSMQPLGRA